MAPAIIAAIIGAMGQVASSYIESRNKKPGPMGGVNNASSGFTPVSSTLGASLLDAGTDVASAFFQQKVKEEEEKQRQLKQQQQQQQQMTQAQGGESFGLRDALAKALARALSGG